MKLTSQIMDKLVKYRNNTNQPDFQKIFPDDNLHHLWGKFDNTYKKDVLIFYNSLDDINKPLLIDYINKNY
tara:strand:- start:2058 stop:2270 length:213 start_codon:yes stop_codon:yes gene_type:complete